ncbi:MAG: hypothetical protein ACK58L_12400 [Planctomycetota bacterium]
MITRAAARYQILLLLMLILTCEKVGAATWLQNAEPPQGTNSVTDESRRATPVGHPEFLSPQSTPIVVHDGLVFVANTPADTVDVIDAERQQLTARIPVGINPVSLAVRPNGKELWVANHISDSVSVIDLDASSRTRFQIVATIQEFDRTLKSTRFDEPVGIAFANDEKAYVALSSENEIAIIQVSERKIQGRLSIASQDPRSLVVRGNRLFVIPFESGNQTQLSGGSKDRIDGTLVTFDAWDHSVQNNNVLSIGHVLDIVKHPRVPDRDLYVFDTNTDKLMATVNTLGTLLYGLAVDSKGNAYIAQTDARNDVNGRAGTKKHGLAEMQNRAFLNRITRVKAAGDASAAPDVDFIDLEPLPPANPEAGMALATPFAIEVSGDDSTIVATAAGSDQVFTISAESGQVLGRAGVGAVPQGLALECSEKGQPVRAWVLNAAANTVTLVSLQSLSSPEVDTTIALEDPTHPVVKRGRIAFSTAASSSTGTFSCASCHPDGHTDQLLWVLKTPIVTGGNQIMPRSTMPIRGLRDTAPFHWDGIPGDPYGGNNSAHVFSSVAPNSSMEPPESAVRHLIDGGLATTMASADDTFVNDEGKQGRLSARERDEMATFLLSVPYPPAQRRAYTNVLSRRAVSGFEMFHVTGDLDPSKPRPNVCGDCHRMPFWVSTNTPGTGMDAPTWRGAYDRWLILPQGRLNVIDFDFYERVAQQGAPERSVWQFSWAGRSRFDNVWNMVLEGSTGFSGAYARQVTLTTRTAGLEMTHELLDALEQAARDGGIVLQGEGVLSDAGGTAVAVSLEFDSSGPEPIYVTTSGRRESWSRDMLISLAAAGQFVGTMTGRLGAMSDVDHPQPALWTTGPIEQQRGAQEFPVLFGENLTMTMSGRHIASGARILVDGRQSAGQVTCNDDGVSVRLENRPPVGIHFLQIQNPNGLNSNDFIFHVASEDPARNDEEASLGRVLRHSKWDRLVGTWVDEATNGAGLTSTWSWKIRDRVLESVSREPDKQSVALIGLRPDNGEIFHHGADAVGSSFDGTWTFPAEGDAVLKVSFFGSNGDKGTINIRYQLVDDDHLTITLELPQPIVVKLRRSD